MFLYLFKSEVCLNNMQSLQTNKKTDLVYNREENRLMLNEINALFVLRIT